MRFQILLKAGLDFVWDTIGIIVRHPLFWVFLIILMFYGIAQSPVPPDEPEVCPTCLRLIGR
jgi:hypothetical protein